MGLMIGLMIGMINTAGMYGWLHKSQRRSLGIAQIGV